MKLIMTGLEHGKAPVELREKLSFTRQQTAEAVKAVRDFPGVSGCVLISTCNRTELYVSCAGGEEPGKLLCRAAAAVALVRKHLLDALLCHEVPPAFYKKAQSGQGMTGPRPMILL